MLTFGLVIDALSKPYPLAIGTRPDADELMTSAGEEEVLHNLSRVGFLLPQDIGRLASRFMIEAGILMLLSTRVSYAAVAEDMRSANEQRPWSWDSFLVDMRRIDPKWWTDAELPKTLAARNMPESARATLQELHVLVANYFQPSSPFSLSRRGTAGHGAALTSNEPKRRGRA